MQYNHSTNKHERTHQNVHGVPAIAQEKCGRRNSAVGSCYSQLQARAVHSIHQSGVVVTRLEVVLAATSASTAAARLRATANWIWRRAHVSELS